MRPSAISSRPSSFSPKATPCITIEFTCLKTETASEVESLPTKIAASLHLSIFDSVFRAFCSCRQIKLQTYYNQYEQPSFQPYQMPIIIHTSTDSFEKVAEYCHRFIVFLVNLSQKQGGFAAATPQKVNRVRVVLPILLPLITIYLSPMSIQFPLTLGYAAQCKNEILGRLRRQAELRKLSLAELEEMRKQISKRQADLTKLVAASHKEISKYFMTFSPLKCNLATFSDLKAFGGPKIAINNNKLYIGTIVDGKRHGKGLIVSQKGKIYEGELLFNERNGYGVQIYEDGNFYIGNFAKSRRCGEGKMVWVNKVEQTIMFQYYNGQWKEGEPHGTGMHYTDEWIYVGQFKNGFRNGKGIEQKGTKCYEGLYANNLKQGKGIEIDEDKQFYQGEFAGGLRNGYGKWRSLRGEEQYEGFYVNNKREGIGVFSNSKEFTYRGLFTDDSPNGTGQYISHVHPQAQTRKDERVTTEFVIKNNPAKRSQLQSAQFVRSNINISQHKFKSQISLKSIKKSINHVAPSARTSRQKEQNCLVEQSRLKLRKRTSISSAKALAGGVDNAEKHACSYKHCSCHKWKQAQPERGRVDEKRLLRLFSGRKTLLKNIS